MLFLPHRSRSLLAALLLSGSTALQATVTTPDNGDIFVGFRASAGQGSGVSLLVNLADDSTLRGATAGSLLSLANLSASLTEVFGADWSTRSDLSWGVFGARNQVNAVTYGSRTQTPVGQPAAPFGVQDLSQRTATKNQIVSVIEAYRLLDAFQANTNAALQTNNLNSGSYSFQVGSVGTSDFGSLSQWVSIEGDFSLGANASVLDFFRFSETGTERLGSFEISSAGAISFTRAQAAGVAGIRLAEATYRVAEDAGSLSLRFRRTDDLSAVVSAALSSSNGSALSGTDYAAQSNVPVSFAIGEFEKTISIPITNRSGISAARDFTVTLSDPSAGAALSSPSTATITIEDSDSEVEFATASNSLRALDSQNQPNSVTVALQRNGSLARAASVSLSVTGGSLSAGTHFTFNSPTLISFGAGEATQSTSIPLNAIANNALPGTIVLSLGSPNQTALGSITSSTITVQPNSGEIAFASATQTANAVNAQNSPNLININLRRSNGSVGAASVTVAVSGGSLLSGTHFVPLANPQTVTFANGATSASLSIQLRPIASALLHSGATLELSLSNPTNSSVLGSVQSSTLTVLGSPGSISIAGPSFNVPEEIGTFQLPLVRSAGSSGAVSVRVSTSNASATAPSDFTALNGVLVSFADGVSAITVPISIANTESNEANETFSVSISSATGGATLGANSSATLRLLDVDTQAPSLTLTAPAANAKLPASPSSVNLIGFARDNKEVAAIELQLNGANVVNVPFATDNQGQANFNFAISPQRGINLIALRSLDHRGNRSVLLTRSLTFDDPFGPLAGSYNGLSLAAEGTTASHSSNGLINLQVLPTGNFSGRLTVDGLVLPFNGFIGNGGIARFGTQGQDRIRLERPNKPGFEVSFTLDVSAGAGPKRILGSVREYRRRALVGNSTFSAERAGFSNASPVPAAYLANKGAYTLVFPAQAQGPAFAAQDYPQGDGVGIASIKANGTVSIIATLADGSSLTASSQLWSSLRFPLYAELYAKAGSLGGLITPNEAQPDSDLRGDDLFWFRPFLNAQHYPDGWPEGLATKLLGAKYAPSSSASSLPGPLADANAQSGNAELVFSDGQLSAPLVKAVNLDSKDKATNAPPTDKSFTLLINQTTGLFNGRFTHSDATQPNYTGVIFQKGPNKGGYGHFLTSTPKLRDGTGESGAVTLTKK